MLVFIRPALILLQDYNKGGEFIPTMTALAADANALKYTDGIALHWYDYDVSAIRK